MTQSAILYARFSSLEQAKGLSIERQLTEGRRFIEGKGWLLEKELHDKGRSAFSGDNRTEGAALHQFEAEAQNGLHSGKVLVVENIDRLSRQGAKAAAMLIWNLNERGVSVATTHDGYVYAANAETNDMMELFSIIIKAQTSYEESFKKSERTKFAWLTRYDKIKSGSKIPTAIKAPAWINKAANGYELNEHRVAVLNEIFDLYLNGVGISKITKILNGRKEPSWSVRKSDVNTGWYEPYVHRLLTKRAVLGEYVTLKGETLSPDYFPQAVTAQKFNQVQAMLASKTKTGGHAYKRLSNLLSGLVRCADCNGMMAYENKGTNRIRHVKKNGETVMYNRKHYERLRCNNARRKHSCSNNFLFDYKLVEACVLEKLTLLIRTDEVRDDHRSMLQDRVAELIRQIEIKANQIENLVDALAEGAKSISARIVKLEAEIEQLKEALQQANEELAMADTLPLKISQVEAIEALRNEISDPDEQTRFLARSRVNAALKRIIEGIYMSENGKFLVQGDDHNIWLIFDENGNHDGRYDELLKLWT
jgi:DNA invertase Pin-like site-specific DNA recombinase